MNPNPVSAGVQLNDRVNVRNQVIRQEPRAIPDQQELPAALDQLFKENCKNPYSMRDIGEEQLEPPTPFDIPAPGDVVVSFDKINELANERKAAGREAAQETKTQEAPHSNEQEQIVYLNLSELHAFKDHPFQVKKDDEMLAMVESVKDKGVTQPAIVRPREDGGYEIVSGHRRQMASRVKKPKP